MSVSANKLGRYELRREIARSNDVVYEAWDPMVNRRVAVKEMSMPPGMTGAAAKDRIQRFYREARAAGGLAHPNIVTVYEVGEDAGRHFIAMEYLEGPTLREMLQGGQGIPAEQAALIAAQVADALSYAHEHGVIHRDVKPDNVHIVGPTLPKLTDFGIARIAAETNITLSGQVFGTPSYMSPEQVAGGEIDARTDIFSLGVMLFEMVTGRKPFIGESVVTITYNIVHETPVIPPNVPDWMAGILRKALHKNAQDRYETAAQMADDLRMHRAPWTPNAADPNAWRPAAGAPNGWGAANTSAPYGSNGASSTYVFQAPPATVLPRVRLPRLSEATRVFLAALGVTLFLGALIGWGIWASRRVIVRQEQYRVEASVAMDRDKAVAAYNANDYPTAIQIFHGVYNRTRDPRDLQNLVNAYVEYGLQLGGPAALPQFQAAAAVSPRAALPRVYIAMYYQQAGQPYMALQYADYALGLLENGSPDASPTVRSGLAQIYLTMGDQARYSGPVAGQGPADLYQRALRADPAGPYGAQAELRLGGTG